MRKILIGIFSLILLTLIPGVVFAKANSSQSTVGQERRLQAQERQEERKAVLEEKKEELKERLEVRRATREAQVSLRKKVRIRFFWERMKLRLLAAADRLDRLIQRMESRLAKIKELNEDADVAAIEDGIEEAKGMLADARIKIDELDFNLENILTPNSPKDAFEEIRGDVKEIKDDLVGAHRLLVHLIGDMKGLRVGQEEGSKVSPTVTVTPAISPTEAPSATPTQTVTPTLTPTPTV